MNRRKFTGTLIAFAVLVSACGSSDDPEEGGDDTSETAESPADDTSDDSGDSSDGDSDSDSGGDSDDDSDADATDDPGDDAGAGDDGSDADDGEDTVLTWTRVSNFPPCFHPICFETGNQHMVMQLIFNSLVKRGPDEVTVIPDLADSWEVSPDATTFTFHLNPDATWHDGEPLTAADVEFTIRQAVELQDGYVAGYPITNWLSLEGADTGEITGIDVVDDQTITLTLGAPNAEFLAGLADPAYMIMPKHILDGETVDSLEASAFATAGEAIGSGPYKLVDFTPDQLIEFDANADYFKGAPQIDKLYKRLDVTPDTAPALIQSGEIDLVFDLRGTDYDLLSGTDGFDLLQIGGVGAQLVQFRVDNPLVADARVRQAIYAGFDRRTLHDAIFPGAGPVAWTDPGLDADTPGLDKYEFDLDRAKALIDEAAADGFDPSAPLRIIYYPEEPGWPEIAAALANDMTNMGLNPVLDPTDSAGWQDRLGTGDYEISLNCCGSFGISPNVGGGFYSCTEPRGTFYQNCELDQLYVDARSTGVPEERAELYAQVAQILNVDLPILFLWTVSGTHAATTRLSGYEMYPNSRESFSQIETWTLSDS